jgi:hypothetical protein
MSSNRDETVVLEQWSARTLRPIVVFYVAMVFAAFMAVAHFILRSPTGVKALALTSVGAIVPLVPSVLRKVEYRATESGIEKRKLEKKDPAAFERVFRWDELSHVVPTRNGFKFYKIMGEPSLLRRFWKVYVSDAYSGEIHVESADRPRVLRIVEEQGIVTSRAGFR